MQVEAPPGEEMERELTAPKIIASLAFQGSLVVLGDEGMPFNPMGMMTCEKAMQKMFCPEKYKVGQSDAPTERRGSRSDREEEEGSGGGGGEQRARGRGQRALALARASVSARARLPSPPSRARSP